jgi:hypothetical protein|nr:MAG TPA: hypothetical protein [Caudoviricetes sp.]
MEPMERGEDMATPRTVRGLIERNTGVSSWRTDTRRRRLQDAAAAFGQDRRTSRAQLTQGGRRAMSNISRRRSLGGNGG